MHVYKRASRCCLPVSLSCILDILPDDVWLVILMEMPFVQQVCRMKRVCRFFTFVMKEALEFRVRKLTGRFYTMSRSPSFYMSHAERAWSGVRLTVIQHRPQSKGLPNDVVLLRGDPPISMGRNVKECNIYIPMVSRYHLLVELNADPMQHHLAKITVVGQNGVSLFRQSRRCYIEQHSHFFAFVDTTFELAPGTGLWYKVTYV